MNKAIEFKNIKKAYGSQVILENFDFSVEKGDFVTIIGFFRLGEDDGA